MLESKSSENEIETDNWSEEMKPGRTIYMTMVVRRKGAVSDNCCRKCRATNIQKIGRSKKIKWYGDGASQLLETANAETFTSLSCKLISDAVESDPKAEVSDAANAMVIRTKTISTEDEAFSRIRYLCDSIPTNAATPKRYATTLSRRGTVGTPSRNVREIFVASSSIAVPQIYHRNELRGGRNDERAPSRVSRNATLGLDPSFANADQERALQHVQRFRVSL